jgi:hypothetical protein
MSVVVDGLKRRYLAEGPETLELLLIAKREKFKAVLPELKDMHKRATGLGQIKYSMGKRGVHTVYNQLLQELDARDFYYVISNLEKWHSLDAAYLDQFIAKRIKKNIPIKLLVQDSEIARHNKLYEKNFLQEVRLLPQETALVTDTVITPQKVVIVQFAEPLTTFVIENNAIIQAHKEYFEIIWRSTQNT